MCSLVIVLVHCISHIILNIHLVIYTTLDPEVVGFLFSLYVVGVWYWVLTMKTVTSCAHPNDGYIRRCQYRAIFFCGMTIMLFLLMGMDIYCWCVIANEERRRDQDDQSGATTDPVYRYGGLAAGVATNSTLAMIITGCSDIQHAAAAFANNENPYPGDNNHFQFLAAAVVAPEPQSIIMDIKE